MTALYPSRLLSVAINRSPQQVYDFVADPANLPQWASGLGDSIAQVDGQWIAQTAQGPVPIRFAERNRFGVLDHYVTVAPGVEIVVPMRVVANGAGSELTLTLFRLPEMNDDKFEADSEWVRHDLATLKKLLEA
jgi:uncharacterized protein YndB with AHSA1/START domain